MRKLLVGIALAASIIPIAVSAQTADELAAQIQALLQQVQALQQQYSGTTAAPTGSTVTPSSVQCPHVSRVLKRGATGADVTRLQQFLALDPTVYPEAQATGYYGALTEAAIKRFQCKNKLVCDGTPESTGYGVTGPRTAALLALQCPDILKGGAGTNAGGFIRVTPTAGNAPLSVSIEATVNTTKSCTGATYEIYYGDNSAPAVIAVPNDVCAEMRQVFNHTYTVAGTYTIILRSGVHQTSATVTVGGGSTQPQPTTGDTFNANVRSGTAPLAVAFTGRINAAAACDAGPYVIQFGDGQSASLNLSGCTAANYTVNHTYTAAGNFTARLLRNSSEVGSIGITVTGGSTGGINDSTQGGGAFAVSPGYGGDAFNVLARFGLSGACTTYDLDWGDGSAHAVQVQQGCTRESAGPVTKEISHIFNTGGTYTITLKRGTGSGQTTDTASVTVVY